MESIIRVVNRSLIVVRVKKPFVDWLNQLPDRLEEEKAHPYTLEIVNMEPSAYLVSEMDEDSDGNFEGYGMRLLESVFAEWTVNEDFWPSPRSLDLLAEWCDLSFHSMVADLSAETPLLHEDVS